MHYKFTAHGAGSGQQAVDYLLRDFDHKGVIRDDVVLGELSADPHDFAELVNTLNFATRYTSMVAGFHPDDQPNAEQRMEIEREFDAALKQGLGDRVSVMHVWHKEGDRWDYHALTAKVDLGTGKYYNPAPEGKEWIFDPIRDHFNAKYGWKSPDIALNPENARLVRPSYLSLNAMREGLEAEVDDPREVIAEHLIGAVANKQIANRKELLEYIRDAGFKIHRQGKDYVTVEHPAINTKHHRARLKGDLFHEHFDFKKRIESEDKAARGASAGRDARRNKAAAGRYYRDFEKRLFKRAEFNLNLYKQSNQEHEADPEINAIGTSGEKPGSEASSDHVQTLDGPNLGSDGWRVDSNTFRVDLHGDFDRATSEGGERSGDLRNDGQDRSETLRSREGADLRPTRQQLQNQRRDRSYSAEVDGKAAFKNQLATELLGGHVVFDNLKYVDVEAGSIFFNDGGRLQVTSQKITAEDMSSTDAAKRIIAGAKAEKWEAIKLTGSDDFFRQAAALAIEEGIKVNPKNAQQLAALEEINEEYRINAVRASVNEFVKSTERHLDEMGQSYESSRDTIAGAVRITREVAERAAASNRQSRTRLADIVRKTNRMMGRRFLHNRYESSESYSPPDIDINND